MIDAICPFLYCTVHLLNQCCSKFEKSFVQSKEFEVFEFVFIFLACFQKKSFFSLSLSFKKCLCCFSCTENKYCSLSKCQFIQRLLGKKRNM